MDKKLTMLMILDGFGINEEEKGNAIKLAKTPNLDKLMKQNPNTTLNASGQYVGLLDEIMGNSEVGHATIGSGRIIYQDLAQISKSIDDGEFFSIPEFVGAIENCKKHNSKLHIMGLLSDKGVHTVLRHLYALLETAKRRDFEDVYLHCFMDGRDSSPISGEGYIAEVEDKMKEKGIGKIVSMIGRAYAMDRDNKWDRTKKAYDLLVHGIAGRSATATSAIENSYQIEITDEYVEPVTIRSSDEEPITISENDSVIFFNFRKDRARQITRALVDKEFKEFETKKMDLFYVCFTEYDAKMPNVHIAFRTKPIENIFGEYISKKGLTQLRIAETEKYAHVTFFFNSGREEPYENEDRILVPSPKVQKYDETPEMSVYGITDKVLESINSNKYDCIILNYCNGDMIGHTGNLDAAIKGIEAVDECVGKVVNLIEEKNGTVLIIADHGNSEQMIDYKTGEPHTAHTTNPVPCILVGKKDVELREDGGLADVAPTMLEVMELDKPEEMTGVSLIKEK